MYSVSKGIWRIVIIIPKLGIAIKVPKVRIGTIWNRYKNVRTLNKLSEGIREEIRFNDHPACSRMCLFGGWIMNLEEAWFSLSNPSNHTIMPTYFSLFGIANIMPAGQPHTVSAGAIWRAVRTVTEQPELDPHTWGSTQNFVRDKSGRLRLVDYGDLRTREVLLRRTDEFERAFRNL